MYLDSGPGLAVVLVGSLLVLLLIGTVVVFSYRRCRHRVERGDDNTIGFAERAAANTLNEPISPVTIYYGETSFQPRQLTRGHDESLEIDDGSIGRAMRSYQAGGPTITASEEEAAPSTVAETFDINPHVSTRGDSVQHNSFTAVPGAPGQLQVLPQSKHQGETFFNKSRRSTAEFTKSSVTIAAVDRVTHRPSLAASTIPEDSMGQLSTAARAIDRPEDSGSIDRRLSDGNVPSPIDLTESNAVRFAATAATKEKYVENKKRSSARSFLAGAGALTGMQRPLPLPPAGLTGSSLNTSESSTDARQSRRESSTSQMSLPVTVVQLRRASDGRHLPRTSWSGPTLQIPTLQTK